MPDMITLKIGNKTYDIRDSRIGDLADLDTTAKNSLVSAINEVFAESAPTDQQVQEAVDAWLEENISQETGYALDRTLTLANAAAPADLVGDLKSAICFSGDSEIIPIEQGYWAIVSGEPIASTTWCRSAEFVDSRLNLHTTSAVRMFLMAFLKTGYYVGTWDGSAFSTTFNSSAAVYTIDLPTWKSLYPDYFFKVLFYAVGQTLTPANVRDSLTVTNTQEESISYIDVKTAKNESKVISIAHRGFSAEVPENTLPSFVMARKNNFVWVEADIEFTSDNVPVIMHDDTINRTGRNADGSAISSTIYVSNITYAQLQTYDFGIWKGAKWAGLKAPSLEQLLILCKNLGMNVLLDIKDNATTEQVGIIISTVDSAGMSDSAIYGSFQTSHLTHIKTERPTATIGLGMGYSATQSDENFESCIRDIKAMRTGENIVFASCGISYMTESYYQRLIEEGIPCGLWTVNTTDQIIGINKNVFLVISDSLNASEIIFDNRIHQYDYLLET